MESSDMAPGHLDITEARRLAGVRFRLFTCVDHATKWPVGGVSIVVAKDEAEARALLQASLEERGLGAPEFTLQEVDMMTPGAHILHYGDY
jgi:hypothetical protein